MAFPLPTLASSSFPHCSPFRPFLCSPSLPPSVKIPHHLLLSLRRRPLLLLPVSAIGPDGKFHPSLSDDDPSEAPKDTFHGVSCLQQFECQVARTRCRQEQFKKDQALFLSALANEQDPPKTPTAPSGDPSFPSVDDIFSDIDHAIALKR